ncbi:hypothetical protein JYT87_02630 [Nitrospira defluvii]|nr:hypothetical protein [Nitrospira defluvii]
MASTSSIRPMSMCLDHTNIGHNEHLIAQAIKEWGGSTPVAVAAWSGPTQQVVTLKAIFGPGDDVESM